MEPLVLTDKSVTPTDELIFSIIGENKEHWKRLLKSVHEKYPDAQDLWNYYNDGKSWLFRMVRKKKTIFWIGILENTFRITFYFGDKSEEMILKSNLPDIIIDEFLNGKRYGKIRAISMKVTDGSEIDNALKLADIRIKS